MMYMCNINLKEVVCIHIVCFKIENLVSCDMNLEEVLVQTAQITSRPSVLEVLEVPLASELIIKRRFSCNPALVGQNIYYVHSGHIHASFAFCQFFF